MNKINELNIQVKILNEMYIFDNILYSDHYYTIEEQLLNEELLWELYSISDEDFNKLEIDTQRLLNTLI